MNTFLFRDVMLLLNPFAHRKAKIVYNSFKVTRKCLKKIHKNCTCIMIRILNSLTLKLKFISLVEPGIKLHIKIFTIFYLLYAYSRNNIRAKFENISRLIQVSSLPVQMYRKSYCTTPNISGSGVVLALVTASGLAKC